MPTRYDEMVEAANEASKKWTRRNESVHQFIFRFLELFRKYCQMPNYAIKLLPWHEEKQVFEGRIDEVIPLWKAVSYDEAKDEWRVGLCLVLSPPDSFHRFTAIAGMHVTEKDYQFTVQIADLKSQQIDLNVQTQCEAYFETLVRRIKDSFSEPKKPRGNQYGFRVETSDSPLQVNAENEHGEA